MCCTTGYDIIGIAWIASELLAQGAEINKHNKMMHCDLVDEVGCLDYAYI